jgi:hypothetical protein
MEIRRLVVALIHADRGIYGCDESNRHFFATMQRVPKMARNTCALEF